MSRTISEIFKLKLSYKLTSIMKCLYVQSDEKEINYIRTVSESLIVSRFLFVLVYFIVLRVPAEADVF